mmetsp:Transcript_10161/g.37211  ORF Transcript_10161/g.37211 Transcript_10161/m.37211 type:complete len:313 (+) Transcript_10161:305-1243(+)
MIPRLWVLLVHAICGYADIVSDHPELFCSEPNSCELQVGQSACCNKNLKCADFMDGGVCTGKVYESTDTEYGFCFCDDFCTVNKDCCEDKFSACGCLDGNDCGFGDYPSPSDASCDDFCADTPDGICYCDLYCTLNQDCCQDYTAICVDAPDTPSSEANGGSCENNCGLLAESDDDFCYCDEFCTTNGDCCSDYTLECADSFPDASCDTLCGSSTEEGCWCEETCTEYGDCWWELLPHHHALDKRLLTSIVCFVCPYTVSITRPSVLFQTLRKIPVRRMIRSAACVAVLQSQESVSVTSTVLGTWTAALTIP